MPQNIYKLQFQFQFIILIEKRIKNRFKIDMLKIIINVLQKKSVLFLYNILGHNYHYNIQITYCNKDHSNLWF
jgi:hypothetical protein